MGRGIFLLDKMILIKHFYITVQKIKSRAEIFNADAIVSMKTGY
jgi:hypothetical protein